MMSSSSGWFKNADSARVLRSFPPGGPDKLVRVVKMPGDLAGECEDLPGVHLAGQGRLLLLVLETRIAWMGWPMVLHGTLVGGIGFLPASSLCG